MLLWNRNEVQFGDWQEETQNNKEVSSLAIEGTDFARRFFAYGQTGIINSEMVNYFPEPDWVG